MTRIQTIDQAAAPAASQPLLSTVQAKLGRVPNLMATMAHSPATLGGYLGLSQTLGEGLFSAAERERIALAVGEANRCDYCLAAHSAIGKMSGLTPDEIAAARLGSSSDPKQAALASFARALTRSAGKVDAATFTAFKAAGWSDGHALEVVAHVALNTLTNYVNHLAGTEVDFPAAAALQTA
ncbi:MAG: carboxymuconolactone decarboxylase family protein [Planctomycetota bacterium]